MVDYNSSTAREYVKENRKELIKLIKHDDAFIRTLGLAVLIEAGDEGDIELAKRELELLQKLDDRYDDLY
ncbi:hypothetical protein [Natranaeroarchaeum aerophilus]|uniref:Uncharacterized protein n=1 Tax=Natranaeroarchaeum aerophilus TaxID=2917711 RepID=A0AAE3K6U3_9EURY|nr:hypothetical protein [Natranaeroarchaeum aerophilus]MCL9815291.1 hypothetical protein [Natranaeroarchaeum aerophilus]